MSFALLFVVSTLAMLAQKVTGVVKDVAGEPLVGVNVKEKGSLTNGTVTKIDGSYEINAEKGTTLVFSYIGFEKKEVVVKGSKLDVYMSEDTKMISDVVVVGYGTMRRKDVTSSITTVKADDLNRGVYSDPAQMLQGKVPGLVVTSTGDPNGTPSITLRGVSTLRADAMSPYYVIDGIPGVDISMVSPDDIESIDVLRDATASAIYGSKAANGVIIITTKSGKSGRTNVSYNAYVGFDKIAKTLDMMSGDDLRSFAKEVGVTLPNDNGGNTDWQKEVLRTGVSHNHNVAINGGNGNTKYMASVNYMSRQGIVKGSEMNRLNLRALLSSKILKDHLDVSVGGHIVYGKFKGVAMNNEGASVMDAMNYYSPLNPVYDADGNYTWDKTSSKNYNPLSMINEDMGDNTWKRQQWTAKAALHIIDGLDWNVNYSFTNRQRTSRSYNSTKSQIKEGYNGYLSNGTYFNTEHSFETFGNYEHTWADIHKLSAMLGYSWEERSTDDGFGFNTYNFADDYCTFYRPDYSVGNNMMLNISTDVIGSPLYYRRDISFYGRLNYSLLGRYIIQGTLRRDGSSEFGKNHRWGTFPSVSAAWNITEEDFMKEQNVLSNLKFRVGYGVSGNSFGMESMAAIRTYGMVDRANNAYGVNKNENSELKWEATAMFNIGIDYAFLGGRINGTIEFYNKKTTDLIWNYPVSTDRYPYGYMTANVGEMTNRGIEFTINADVIQSRGFRWNTSLNLSHNMNRVDKLTNKDFYTSDFFQGDPMVAGVSANGSTQNIMEGEALGTFYTYEFAGFNDKGRATYYVHDATTGARTGETTTAPSSDRDRVKTGCAQPKLTLGWNNTLTWRDWSATVFFTGSFGNKIYNGSRANYMSAELFSNGKNVLKDYASDQAAILADGTKVLCTDANIPSDRWIENGSYLRLQTLTLGYTFRKFDGWIKDLTLYGTANNLFTITSYKGLDPEVNMGGISPGVDYRWSTYPHTRSYIVGVKVNF